MKYLVLTIGLMSQAIWAAEVPLRGNVPNMEIRGLQAKLNRVWDHQSHNYLPADLLQQTPPPEIHFYQFDRAQESQEFVQWQREWVINNKQIWLDWTQLNGISPDQVTQEWIRANVDQIFPFPKTFLAFHYDGTNKIQINPDRTFLAYYVNSPEGIKTDYVGFGFYSAAHEMLHYILDTKKVPGRLHHCMFVSNRGEQTPVMQELADYLVSESISSELVKRIGWESEQGLQPCSQLSAPDQAEAARYIAAGALSPASRARVAQRP